MEYHGEYGNKRHLISRRHELINLIGKYFRITLRRHNYCRLQMSCMWVLKQWSDWDNLWRNCYWPVVKHLVFGVLFQKGIAFCVLSQPDDDFSFMEPRCQKVKITFFALIGHHSVTTGMPKSPNSKALIMSTNAKQHQPLVLFEVPNNFPFFTESAHSNFRHIRRSQMKHFADYCCLFAKQQEC